MTEDEKKDAASVIWIMSFISGGLTAGGFDRIGWAWQFGALLGFFVCFVGMICIVSIAEDK